MEKLGVMIRGAGWVAGEHIKAVLANSRTELKVLDSRLQRELDEKQETYGLDCELTVDQYEQHLERDDIDLVNVCTVSCDHTREAVQAANAGKHVFIEKPIALTLDELRQLRDAVQKSGVAAGAGFVVRFYPLIANIRKMIDQGVIGDVFYGGVDYWHEITGEWKTQINTAGSALLMGGCHSIDTLQWLMDSDIAEVSAYSSRPARRPDFEYDPNIVVNVKFANGNVGRVACSVECNMPYVFHVELKGTEGAIRNDKLFSTRIPHIDGWITLPCKCPDSPDVTHHPFDVEIDYFVDSVLSDRVEADKFWDQAVRAHEACFAADRSAASGGAPVKLPIL